MKIGYGVLAVFLIMLIGLIIYTVFINNTTHEYVKRVSEVESYIDKDDFENAQKGFDNIISSWKKGESFFTTVMDHKEMDVIKITLERSRDLLKTRQKPLLTAELAVLKTYFEHIGAMEQFTLENLL